MRPGSLLTAGAATPAMTVFESDLPGVGKKFEVELDGDERLVVVTHNTGKREVFHRRGNDDAEKLFELSDRLARQVGTILEGAYFRPVATETTETMLDEDTLFEWVSVVEGSDLVGHTLEELDFREETGASVVAVQRDGETESNSGARTTVRAGDTWSSSGRGRSATRSSDSPQRPTPRVTRPPMPPNQRAPTRATPDGWRPSCWKPAWSLPSWPSPVRSRAAWISRSSRSTSSPGCSSARACSDGPATQRSRTRRSSRCSPSSVSSSCCSSSDSSSASTGCWSPGRRSAARG